MRNGSENSNSEILSRPRTPFEPYFWERFGTTDDLGSLDLLLLSWFIPVLHPSLVPLYRGGRRTTGLGIVSGRYGTIRDDGRGVALSRGNMRERSSHFPRSISLNLGQSASKPRDDGTTLQNTSGSGPIRGNLDMGARG